jgi:SAM-dependent methyltransferase
MPVRSVGPARAAEAGLHNINFVHTDIAEYSADSSFDAAVGRCIPQFIPAPVAALRSVAKQIRPDGIVAFQEVSWAPCISLSAHLPLWSAAVSLVHEAGIHSGVNMEMGPALHNSFQETGLPAPRMRLEMALRRDLDFTRWVSDLLRSAFPQIQSSTSPKRRSAILIHCRSGFKTKLPPPPSIPGF